MGESTKHREMVKIIYDYLYANLTTNMKNFIKVDSSETQNNIPPVLLSLYRPDVFFKQLQNVYIGEAKTSKDIFTEHSIAQYTCALNYLNMFDGDREFIICVPLLDYVKTKNYFRKLKIKNSIKYRIRILNDKGENCLI